MREIKNLITPLGDFEWTDELMKVKNNELFVFVYYHT